MRHSTTVEKCRLLKFIGRKIVDLTSDVIPGSRSLERRVFRSSSENISQNIMCRACWKATPSKSWSVVDGGGSEKEMVMVNGGYIVVSSSECSMQTESMPGCSNNIVEKTTRGDGHWKRFLSVVADCRGWIMEIRMDFYLFIYLFVCLFHTRRD